MKPLIVGEAPNRTGDPRKPIAGAAGEKLAAQAGLTLGGFARRFERTNVLDYWPGTDGKGACFPRAEARERALQIADRIYRQRRNVLLLGKRVAFVFGAGGLGYFEPFRFGAATIYVVPHPSGINRWHNEAANRAKMRRFMRRFARK